MSQSVSPTRAFTRVLLPVLDTSAARMTEDQANLRMAVVALRLDLAHKAKGHYPLTLGDIRAEGRLPPDPFSGEDFIYRPAGNGYLLCSDDVNVRRRSGDEQKKPSDLAWRIRE